MDKNKSAETTDGHLAPDNPNAPELDDAAKKKKEDYLRNPGKIEDYPDQDDVPGESVADTENDKK